MSQIDLDIISLLQDIPIFKSMSVQEIEKMAQLSLIKTYASNEEIVCAGDDSTELYTILSGRARVLNYSLSGREVIYDDLYEGAIFGEICALDEMGRSAHVLAQTEVKVMVLSRSVFLDILYDNPQVTIDLALHMAAIIRVNAQRIFDASTKSTRTRLLNFLSTVAQETSPDQAEIAEKMTHKIIAGRLGSTRESITRLLNQLVDEGLLRRDGGKFIIPSLQRIHAASEVEE